MIKATLIAKTDVEPRILSSHAAKTCYTSKVPELGATIDVENRLFKPGHHTTLQHNYFTFNIDNASVSSTVFNFYKVSPFYTSDQRSGRFSKMFEKPDFNEIEAYMKAYYPKESHVAALDFIKYGLRLYAENKERLDELSAEHIKKERPFANDDYIKQNAPKLAQEQLRVFISQIFPTSFDYTLNISSLSALHRVAWNSEMRDVVSQMVAQVVEIYPDMKYMFSSHVAAKADWAPEFRFDNIGLKEKPGLELLDVDFDLSRFQDDNIAPDTTDIMYFSPLAMDNSLMYVKSKIEMSCASAGQDQRHRTIKRSKPIFTGNFYLPPLLKVAGLADEALDYMKYYVQLSSILSPTFVTALSPYGAMISYEKLADFNTLMHEQAKRTCWCAQEEIYHSATLLRERLAAKLGDNSPFLEKLAPHCFASGQCCEGVRYCGRDIRKTPKKEYFKERVI